MSDIIKSLSDIRNGDTLYKNTKWSDRDKALFMRTVNFSTELIQSIHEWKLIRGKDHSEFLCWNKGILETHSSVYGQGVRTMAMINWIYTEDSPYVINLRRKEVMNPDQYENFQYKIAKMRGLPYNLKRARKSILGKDISLGYLEGLFCSESTMNFSGFEKYEGFWPYACYMAHIERGDYVVFEGDIEQLTQTQSY